MLPLFIYFVTVDWLKYEWVKLLFHAVPFMPYLRGSDSTIVLYVFPQYTIHNQWSQWLCTRVILYTHMAACQLDDCPSVSQSVSTLSATQSINWSASHSVNLLVSQLAINVSQFSVSHLIIHTVNKSVRQSVSCFIGQLVSQSICQLVSQSVVNASHWTSHQ